MITDNKSSVKFDQMTCKACGIVSVNEHKHRKTINSYNPATHSLVSEQRVSSQMLQLLFSLFL